MSETQTETTTEAAAAKPSTYVFQCRVGHRLTMLENSLRLAVSLRDADDKVTGVFQSNNLCPACVVNTLNALAETFPVPVPVDSTDAK